MKNHIRGLLATLAMVASLIINFQISTAFAQGTTAFTYQGQLRDNGTNANGTYTMIFKLYDSLSGGNQINSTIATTNTLVNGLFTVNLDFGSGAFTGPARYLDITVTNGGVLQELSPRVQVLPSPYSLYAAVAATVTNGAIMNPQLATSAVNANNIAGGQVVKSLNGLEDAVSLSAGANVTITPSGSTLQIAAQAGGGVVVTNELAAGNNVGLFTNSGIVQISSFVPNIQPFGESGTFTVPTNVTRIMVEMWGAGGGGGNGYTYDDEGDEYRGGGGGGGAYNLGVFAVTPGASYSIIVPQDSSGGANGGTASISGPGISMTAGGGSAGSNASASGNGAGGAGGNGTGGFGNTQGQGGDNRGDGGGTWRGGGIQLAGVQITGQQSSGPGNGGPGGGEGNPLSGNSGASGLVLIYY